MEDSILITIKKMLGLDAAYTAYDTDVISKVNTFLFTLTQLGVGPNTGFRITGTEETWSQFIGDRIDLEAVKDFMYIKARIVFDPPASASALQALKEEAKELEFRINVQVD